MMLILPEPLQSLDIVHKRVEYTKKWFFEPCTQFVRRGGGLSGDGGWRNHGVIWKRG
jgi:hypothetical protein